MSQRLPPLNALRAFEAAARHLNFSKAAAELYVTPAAISHQIKGLEEFLGVQLFRRRNKNLLLTDSGQAALPALREGFARLADAIELMRSGDVERILTVSVAPSFAGKWLVPRLDRFRESYPGIDVRVDANSRLVDFARDDVDIAIRYGSGDYPGLHVDCLLADEIVPVCSPRLLTGSAPLKKPADLRKHTLLHIEDPIMSGAYPDWKMWLLSAGIDDIDATRGPRFSQSNMAIQAAVEGHGVALAGSILVADDLAAGRLVKPFALSFPVNFCYYLVCPQATLAMPKMNAFREWLLSQTGAIDLHKEDHSSAFITDC